jgi:lysophospholipase L1-like esterase
MRRFFLLGFLCAATGLSAAEPLKVVCFGDSITGDRPRKPYLHQYVKFSDMLQLMLEAKLGTGNVVVLNRGWGGDKTPGAVKRLQEDVLDEKPAIVIMLIGGNDPKDDDARAQTTANLTGMVQQLKAAKIKVLLLQYAVLDAGEKTWRHLAGNNDLIAAVAKELDVPTLALQPAFDAAAKTQPATELVNAVDGVHLNPGGEIVVARAIFTKLVELGWIK